MRLETLAHFCLERGNPGIQTCSGELNGLLVGWYLSIYSWGATHLHRASKKISSSELLGVMGFKIIFLSWSEIASACWRCLKEPVCFRPNSRSIMNLVWGYWALSLRYTQMDVSSKQEDGWDSFATEAMEVDEISSGDSIVWEDSLESDSINEKRFSTTTTLFS